jgi:hypothetical protein
MGWHADVTTTAPTPFALEVLKVQVLDDGEFSSHTNSNCFSCIHVGAMIHAYFTGKKKKKPLRASQRILT